MAFSEHSLTLSILTLSISIFWYSIYWYSYSYHFLLSLFLSFFSILKKYIKERFSPSLRPFPWLASLLSARQGISDKLASLA